MKSKVILVCVFIFCSKIVDSIPHSENHVRQRVNPPSNWQVNKNVPNAQYLDTDFTQTLDVKKMPNSAIQLENNEDYYSDQRGYNYDSYEYNKGPASSPSAKELLVSYDSPDVGRRLDTYPPRVESYPSHTSQVGFDHHQYRNQKWRSQNPFAISVPRSVLIPNDESPLVTSVQEPYQSLAQYLQPKHVPSSNRRFYQPERSYPTREQFRYTSIDHSSDDKYIVNPATRFGSRGPVPYENYSDGQASETKTRPIGFHRHVQNETPSKKNYENPAVEFSETVADQTENIRSVTNSRSHLRNAAPIRSHDDGSSVISDTDNYSSNLRPSNLAPVVNIIKDATVEISKIVDHKPLAHKHAHRADSGWSNITRDNSYNDAPSDTTETVEVKEGKYGANYVEENAFPVNTYPEDSPTQTVLENSESNTYAERNVPQYGSSSPNNSKQNAVNHLTSGIQELSLKSLVANPEIQNILARTNKRYVVIHLDGTIEYLDTLPLDSQQGSNLRLVHTKRKSIDGSEGEVSGVLTPQSPQNLPSNMHKTPVDEYPWPTNYQPTDEYDSNPVIPFRELPAGHSHLKKLHPLAEQPADTENSKLLPTLVNQSADGSHSKLLIPNENHTRDDSNSNQREDDHDSKSKVFPNEVQPAYDANPKPSPKNQSGDKDNSKPLPYDVNHQKYEDILKHLTSPENQPRDDDNSKPLLKDVNQSLDKFNLNPNTFSPILPNKTRPSDDRNSESLPAYATLPAHDTKPKHSHGNQPENDDSSNPSSPNKNQSGDDKKSKPLTSLESQLADNNDSKLMHPYKRKTHNHHHYQLKSRHSHEDQPLDDDNLNPSSTLESLTNPEKLSGDINTAKPLPSNDKQSGDDTDSNPLHPNKRHTVYHTKPKHLDGNEPEEEYNSKPSSTVVNQTADDNNSKPFNDNLSADDIVPKLLHPYYEHYKKPKHSNVNLQADDNNSNVSTPEPLDYAENQPRDSKNSKPLDTNENKTGDDNPAKPLPTNENKLGDNKTSKTLPSNENDIFPYKQSGVDNTSKTLNENQSVDETDSTLLPPHKKQQAHYKKSKQSHVHKPANDNNSNPSVAPEPSDYPEDEPGDDKPAKSLPSNENQSNKKSKPLDRNENQTRDENGSELLSPHKKQQENHKKSKQSHAKKTADDKNLNPVSPGDHQTNDTTSKPLHSNVDSFRVKQTEDDKTAKTQTLYENQSESYINSKPLLPHKKSRAHHNQSKPKHTHVNLESDDDNSNPDGFGSTQDENQPGDGNAVKPLPSNKNQSEDETDAISSLSHKKQRPRHKKPKHSNVNLQSDDNNSNPSNQDENQPRDGKAAKPLPLNEIKSGDEIVTTPLAPQKKQRAHHRKRKPSHVNKSVDDNNSKISPDETQLDDEKSTPLPPSKNQLTTDNDSKPSAAEENLPENYIESKPLPASENKPSDDLNSKPTPSVSSKNDDESKSTTLSPSALNYTVAPKPKATIKHKRKYRHRKNTSISSVVSTTASPDDSSEDQIITISPIEQVTDNLGNVPTLTTTTAKPVRTSDKKDTYKDANNKPDEAQDDTKSSSEDLAGISDKVQTSTTTATPSSSTSTTDAASDHKSKGNETKSFISKENNGKENTQIAVYNSSELLDTNTDVPEETDDYLPAIPSPSVQNDVNTGDASDDNSSELEQSVTDVTITVSSSTTHDSEDDIITVNIEVSESTDDADSPSSDKTLVVNIDTNPESDDDSKTLQTDVSKNTGTEDCEGDHDHDDDTGNNVEIDLSNLKAEPTMWIKTTNKDIIDKLTSKNETHFDVVYFFNIENQPIIEREKETTIYCNGTVVIETTEITYAHKDDSTPTIVKTTQIMQIEDYELYK